MTVIRRTRTREPVEREPVNNRLTTRRLQKKNPQVEVEPQGPGRVIEPTSQEEKVLSEIIRRSRWEARRPRSDSHLHVSDLLSKCLRKKAIIEQLQVSVSEAALGIMDSLTFRVGEAIHDVIRERAAEGGRSEVWGKWKCKCGGLRVDDPCTYGRVPATVCDFCGGRASEYVEVSFFDQERAIIGHPDLILYRPALGAYYVTELKSIANDRWKELARPDPDHVLQALFYWYLMKLSGYDMVDQCSILYVTKGWTMREAPYKEFHFTPSANIHRLESYLREAEVFVASRNGGALPGRVCVSADSPEAKKCQVCSQCFSSGDKVAKPVKVSIADAMRPASAPRSASIRRA